MLYAASGNVCAFRGCNTKLVDLDSKALLGEMCHINAISPGGLRYDPHQKDSERDSYENLIILCANHHSLIDQDPIKYTASVLRSMKTDHEAFVAESIIDQPLKIESKLISDFSRQVETESIDFAIVVALSEELKALKHHFPELQRVFLNGPQSRTYYKAIIPTKHGGAYRVIVTLLHSMGNIEASHATSDLIRDWNPRYVLVNGIAGGLCHNEQRLGDIVVSDSIVYYEPGKVGKNGVVQRNKQFLSDRTLIDGILNFFDTAWYATLPAKPVQVQPDDTFPKIHVGPIASGEKVIADAGMINDLRKYQSNLIAVEMESAGVASAAFSALKQIGFITIRAICDFADSSKNDQWHEYAASTAASYLRAFLENRPVSLSEGKWPERKSSIVVTNGGDLVETRRRLFNKICSVVDIEEFKNFCFLIGIDFDNLPGDRISSHVRELILLFENSHNIDVLINAVDELITDIEPNKITIKSNQLSYTDNLIFDKWVSTQYVEKSGITKNLQDQGYELRWTTAKKECERVEFQNWEPVLLTQPDGRKARLKIHDHSSIGGYLILLKKKKQ